MAERQDRPTHHIPSGYYDVLVLAPEDDDDKADILRAAIEESTEIEACLERGCRVELIEEASGDNSDFLCLVDKGIDATPMILAIISEQYCDGRDQEAMSKFTMVLSDRIQKRGHDKVLLVPVYTPNKLSPSSWAKLPRFITMLHSYNFDPGDEASKTRFFKRLAGIMNKRPFKTRMNIIIDKLSVEEGKKRLDQEKMSFDLHLQEYHNKTKHMREMRAMQQELQQLQVGSSADLTSSNMPATNVPVAEYSFPSGQLRGPSDPASPGRQYVARGVAAGYPSEYSPPEPTPQLTPPTAHVAGQDQQQLTSQPRSHLLGITPHSASCGSANPGAGHTTGTYSPSPSLEASARTVTSPQVRHAENMSEPITLPNQNEPPRSNTPTSMGSEPVRSSSDPNVLSGTSPAASVLSAQSPSSNTGSGQGVCVLSERPAEPHLYTSSNATECTTAAPHVAPTQTAGPQLSQDELSDLSTSSIPMVPNLFRLSTSISSSGSEAELMRSQTLAKTAGYPIQETQQVDLNLSQHDQPNSDERPEEVEAGARVVINEDGAGIPPSVNMPIHDQVPQDGGINYVRTVRRDAGRAPAAHRLHIDGVSSSTVMSATDQIDRQSISSLVDSTRNGPYAASSHAERAPPTNSSQRSIPDTGESHVVDTSDAGVRIVGQESMGDTEFDFRSDPQLLPSVPETALVTATTASISGEAFRGLAHTEEGAAGESG